MATGRHIRHDWKTFVNWEQVSVRTVCGMTSRQGLTGIPGITEQPRIVDNKWGWCMRCVKSAVRDYDGIFPQIANTKVAPLYAGFIAEIQDQYGLNRVREAARDLAWRKMEAARQAKESVVD